MCGLPNQRFQRAAREFMFEQLAVRQRETQRRFIAFGKAMLQCNELLPQLLREFAVRRKVDLVVLEDLFVHERLQ